MNKRAAAESRGPRAARGLVGGESALKQSPCAFSPFCSRAGKPSGTTAPPAALRCASILAPLRCRCSCTITPPSRHRQLATMPATSLAGSRCGAQLSSHTRRAFRAYAPAALAPATARAQSGVPARAAAGARAAPGALEQRANFSSDATRARVRTLAAAAGSAGGADDRIPATVRRRPCRRPAAPGRAPAAPPPRAARPGPAPMRPLPIATRASEPGTWCQSAAGGHRLPGLGQDDAAEPHPHAAARQAHRGDRERGGAAGRLPATPPAWQREQPRTSAPACAAAAAHLPAVRRRSHPAAASRYSARLLATPPLPRTSRRRRRALPTAACQPRPANRGLWPLQFGEIDIDSELVARTEVLEGTQDTVLMLNNGCLCCTVGAAGGGAGSAWLLAKPARGVSRLVAGGWWRC
jgi:hypothetical protein